jgi:hypothetical protein
LAGAKPSVTLVPRKGIWGELGRESSPAASAYYQFVKAAPGLSAVLQLWSPVRDFFSNNYDWHGGPSFCRATRDPGNAPRRVPSWPVRSIVRRAEARFSWAR